MNLPWWKCQKGGIRKWTYIERTTDRLSSLDCKLTLLVELLCALAPLWQPHNGHHLGTQTGAPLLSPSQRCRVWAPAARTFLQAVHGPWDTGGAHHVPGSRAQPAQATHPSRAGHLHGAAEHHGPVGLEGRWAGGEKGLESLAWQKRRERTESQVIVKVQIGEKSSNKRTSWRAVCLIKHSGKACLTAAAAAPRGWRTPSFDFNHSLVLHTYCRGSKNEFLHYKRHNEKVKSSKKSFSSSTVLKTEKTKNTKVSRRGQCRWQHTVQVR